MENGMVDETGDATHLRNIKVINLFGAPGMGKSATAAGLFWLMKTRHMSVEHVSEYAKYLVLTHRTQQLREEQLYLLAKQHHKQHILRGSYEFCVTDSPLMLCSFYANKENTPDEFFSCVKSYWDRFENINFFVTRNIDEGEHFEETGRIHDRKQSLALEKKQREFLAENGIRFTDITIDERTPWVILDHILALSDDPSVSEPAAERIIRREEDT